MTPEIRRKPFKREFNSPTLTTILISLRLMDAKSQAVLKRKMFAQAMLGILDFIGVALIGVLGAIAVSGIKSSKNQGVTEKVLRILGLEDLNFQSQVAWIGIVACSFLMMRTFLSIIITQRALRFLALQSSKLGDHRINISN